MIEYYRQLLAGIHESKAQKNGRQLCITAAIKGSTYQPGEGVMVVGRVADQQHIRFTKGDMISNEGILAAVANQLNAFPLENIGKKWRKNWLGFKAYQSPFWRVALHLSREWTGGDMGNMVWSNLYKISDATGDPDEALRALQLDSCKELLLLEIAFYKPKVVVLLTGMDWAAPFLEGVQNIMKDTSRATYLKFAGRYDDVPVMAAIQPAPGVSVYFPGQVSAYFELLFMAAFCRMAEERTYIELDDWKEVVQKINEEYIASKSHSKDYALSSERGKAIRLVKDISTLQYAAPESIPRIVKDFYQLRFPMDKDYELVWERRYLLSAAVKLEEGEALVVELAERYPNDSFIFVKNAYGPEGLYHVIVSDGQEAIDYLKNRS